MKKFFVAAVAFTLLAFAGSFFAQTAGIGLKGGTAHANVADKFGFNSSLEIGANVNPYFEIFGKPGFAWFSWDKGMNADETVGTQRAQIKSNNDAYAFPLLAGAKFKLADAKESVGFIPYISAAAGYSWMKYKYKQPAYTDATTAASVKSESYKGTFKGFTCEFLGGLDIPLGGTNMSFSEKAGYRSMKLKKGSAELNVSGFLANIGVTFAIGG